MFKKLICFVFKFRTLHYEKNKRFRKYHLNNNSFVGNNMMDIKFLKSKKCGILVRKLEGKGPLEEQVVDVKKIIYWIFFTFM